MRTTRWRGVLILLLCWTLGCDSRAEPPASDVGTEDLSDKAVEAENVKPSEDVQARLRAAYKEEVQECEEVLRGEWERPGLCCVWTAMGCVEQPLSRRGVGNG